MKSSLI
jgi:hypothetical protein